jgi:hypothetical protein
VEQSFFAGCPSPSLIASGVLGGLARIKILDNYIGDIDSFIGDIDKIVTKWFWLDWRRFVILVTRPGATSNLPVCYSEPVLHKHP